MRKTIKTQKRMSLSPQTIRIQHRLAEWSKSGRKHWDLYRWLLDPKILFDAAKLIIANDGAAGVDKVSCSEVKGKEWEFAVELAAKLKSGRYRPSAVRRVYIPKRDGRQRPLGIPCLEDRVIQRALVLLLEPIYEKVFLSNSYGFRRGHSGVECVAVAAKEVYSHRLILEADIESFFDRVSHRKLLGMLKGQIVDPRILNLIRSYLEAGCVERDKPWQPTWEGTPQGGPLTPPTQQITWQITGFRRAGERDRMFDGQGIGTDKNFFDNKAQNALAVQDVQTHRRLSKPAEESLQSFLKLAVFFLIHGFGFKSLQFGFQRSFFFSQMWNSFAQFFKGQKSFLVSIEQMIDSFFCSSQFFQEGFFANQGRLGILNLMHSTVDFHLNQLRILKHLDNLSPNQIIQIILPDGKVGANPFTAVAPIIRSQTAVIINFPQRSPRRSPVISIITLRTNKHSLQERRLLRVARSKMFVLDQTFLRQLKSLLIDQGRNRNFNPLFSCAFTTGTTTWRKSAFLTQEPCDLLAFDSFCLSKTSCSFVSRIPQYRPNSRSFPRRFSLTSRNVFEVQVPCDRTDALSFLRVEPVNFPNDGGLFFNHLVESVSGLRFPNVAVTVGSPAKYIDKPTFGSMPLSTPGAFRNLRPLVFSNHALKLQKQLVFRSVRMRRFDKNNFHSLPGKFFNQKHLVSIFTAEPVRRINQHRFNLSFGRQIPKPLKSRPHQNRSAVTFVLKNPFRRNCVALALSIFHQSRDLASDGLLFLLSFRRNPRVNGGCLHSKLLFALSIFLSENDAAVFEEPADDKLVKVSAEMIGQKNIAPESFAEASQPSLLRNSSQACVTIPLKDSPLDLTRCLKRRVKPIGSFTVKTLFGSGIGSLRLVCWAHCRYRYACLDEMPCLLTSAETIDETPDRFDNNSSTPLMRWANWASEDLLISHLYRTFCVKTQAVIPAPAVSYDSFKLKVCDCVHGVLSPMLANIYLHYALDVRFKELGLKATQLFRYCDDFVIASRNESELLRVRKDLDRWMQEAGLRLKEAKTRLVDMRNEKRNRESHFDFLGFRFHLRAFKDNPKRFWIARQPSERARLALRDNLKAKVRADLSPGIARNVIKSIWRGWSNYFRYGNSNRIFYKETHSVRRIVWGYLRRKFRHQRRPVPWWKLSHLENWIMRDLKPLSVIPNYLSQQRQFILL